MKFVLVLLALVYVTCSIDAAPALLNELSLRLQPPEAPHNHHHHHTVVNPTKAPSAGSSTTTTKKPTAEIIRYEYVNLPDGGYRFSYETSDGQTRSETGSFKDDGDSGKILQVVGSYTYNGDDGKRYIVNYTADENGYNQTEGALPAGLSANVIATLAG